MASYLSKQTPWFCYAQGIAISVLPRLRQENLQVEDTEKWTAVELQPKCCHRERDVPHMQARTEAYYKPQAN